MIVIQIESCKDCLNLDDRRDIDKVALCAMHHGPSVSCQEFKPKNGRQPADVSSCERFCVNCANFDDVHGVAVCARDHQPGVACGSFTSKMKN